MNVFFSSYLRKLAAVGAAMLKRKAQSPHISSHIRPLRHSC